MPHSFSETLILFAGVYLSGLALNLTPCIYPMLSVTVSLFSREGEKGTGGAFLRALVYVLGLSTMFSVLGFGAAIGGAIFGQILQNPLVLTVIGLVILVLAGGMLGLYTGTGTTGRMAINSHVDGIQFGSNEWIFETRANIQNLSDATNTFTTRFGFMDATTGDPTDGHFFRYTHGTNSGKWQAVTRINNVETATDTGETATAMTNGSPMPRWKIVVDNSGTSVDFYINDRRVVTHTPSGFTGSSRLTGIAYSIIKSAGTTTRAFFIDYTLFACKLGTNR